MQYHYCYLCKSNISESHGYVIIHKTFLQKNRFVTRGNVTNRYHDPRIPNINANANIQRIFAQCPMSPTIGVSHYESLPGHLFFSGNDYGGNLDVMIYNKLDKIETKIDHLKNRAGKLDEKSQRLENRIQQVSEQMNKRFEQTDQQLHLTYERLERMEQMMKCILEKIDNYKDKIDSGTQTDGNPTDGDEIDEDQLDDPIYNENR